MKEGTIQEKTFDDHVKEWEKLSTELGKASSQADEYYDKHILPDVKEKFTKTYRPEQKYDGLILTVGGSPEPVILSICAIESERVGLICNKGRKKSIDRIVKETDLVASDLVAGACEVDGSNTIEIYKVIMDFYAKWGKPEKIALGITGGTKVMSSSAAMAGAILGADIYYVATEAKNILNKPVPRKEYLHLVDNPYSVFGDLEVEKARDLYNGHDYAGAQRVFDQLEKQVGDPSLATVHEAYEHLCAAYELWDNIDFKKALEIIDKLVPILTRYSSLPGLTNLHSFHPTLLEQRVALEVLEAIAKNEKLALSIDEGFHFAFMLYHSALRRENQGKLDMACLLLYRLLEWIGQHRLAQYSINSSEPDYSKSGMDQDDLLANYKSTRKRLYKKNTGNIESLPSPIALIDGFLILDALGDKIVEDLNWNALSGQVDIRNKNIFAHGINKISPDSYEKFKSTVEKRFEKAQEIANIDTDVFNKQHQFIKPLP